MRLVHGVGINDLDYQVSRYRVEDGKQITEWNCPFYTRWKEVLRRCHSVEFKNKCPTYRDVSCIPEWHTASVFIKWMKSQPWEGRHLDKDIIQRGNRVYSPDTCAFVLPMTNSFVSGDTRVGNKYLLGAYENKSGRFKSCIGNPFTGGILRLGSYSCAEDAHEAWRKQKEIFANQLAEVELDDRASYALINRYEKSNWYKDR